MVEDGKGVRHIGGSNDNTKEVRKAKLKAERAAAKQRRIVKVKKAKSKKKKEDETKEEKGDFSVSSDEKSKNSGQSFQLKFVLYMFTQLFYIPTQQSKLFQLVYIHVVQGVISDGGVDDGGMEDVGVEKSKEDLTLNLDQGLIIKEDEEDTEPIKPPVLRNHKFELLGFWECR